MYASANYWILEGVIETRPRAWSMRKFLRENLFLPAGMRHGDGPKIRLGAGAGGPVRFWTAGIWPLGRLDYGDILNRPPAYRTLLSTAEDLRAGTWRCATGRFCRPAPSKSSSPEREHYADGWNVARTSRDHADTPRRRGNRRRHARHLPLLPAGGPVLCGPERRRQSDIHGRQFRSRHRAADFRWSSQHAAGSVRADDGDGEGGSRPLPVAQRRDVRGHGAPRAAVCS